MKPHLPAWQPFRTRLSRYFLFWLAITLVSCEKCDIYPERPNKGRTEIFGHVVDEKTGLPVEGLEMIVRGTKNLIFTHKITLKSSFTNQDGRYRILLEVPNDVSTLTIIPFIYYPSKFDPHYYDYTIIGINRLGCCTATIGQSTEYNFELIPRQ